MEAPLAGPGQGAGPGLWAAGTDTPGLPSPGPPGTPGDWWCPTAGVGFWPVLELVLEVLSGIRGPFALKIDVEVWCFGERGVFCSLGKERLVLPGLFFFFFLISKKSIVKLCWRFLFIKQPIVLVVLRESWLIL